VCAGGTHHLGGAGPRHHRARHPKTRRRADAGVSRLRPASHGVLGAGEADRPIRGHRWIRPGCSGSRAWDTRTADRSCGLEARRKKTAGFGPRTDSGEPTGRGSRRPASAGGTHHLGGAGRRHGRSVATGFGGERTRRSADLGQRIAAWRAGEVTKPIRETGGPPGRVASATRSTVDRGSGPPKGSEAWRRTDAGSGSQPRSGRPRRSKLAHRKRRGCAPFRRSGPTARTGRRRRVRR
jgi:hypothetical protein